MSTTIREAAGAFAKAATKTIFYFKVSGIDQRKNKIGHEQNLPDNVANNGVFRLLLIYIGRR